LAAELVLLPQRGRSLRPRFDPSLFTREQLAQIETTLRMVAAAQAEAENDR
jgi:hypothetical protein